MINADVRSQASPADRRLQGVSIMTAATGVGVAVVYLISGLISQANGSMRTVFWVIAAFAALSLPVAWPYRPDPHIRRQEPIDCTGAVGTGVGLVAVVLAITDGNAWEWMSGAVRSAGPPLTFSVAHALSHHVGSGGT